MQYLENVWSSDYSNRKFSGIRRAVCGGFRFRDSLEHLLRSIWCCKT